MAGTDSDDTTDGGWRLLSDEHTFIAGLTKSEKLADKLIRAFLERGELDHDGRRRYRIWRVEAWPGSAPSPHEGDFWRPDPERGIQCEIDYQHSSARWTGPASPGWKANTGRQTAKYQITLIWLWHNALVEFLQSVGLLPLSPESVQPSAPEPASEIKTTANPVPQSPKDWLRGAKRRRPKGKNERQGEWGTALLKDMEADHKKKLVAYVWARDTLMRRLRDKDSDDEGYKVGGS
jgi:hypothetical protein